MNITIESKPKRKPGPFTGKKQSPNQSLSARINNLQRSCDSKAEHLSKELENFELWMVDNMPPEMHAETRSLRTRIRNASSLLVIIADFLRQYNQNKPVYELDLINKVTASSLKNTP